MQICSIQLFVRQGYLASTSQKKVLERNFGQLVTSFSDGFLIQGSNFFNYTSEYTRSKAAKNPIRESSEERNPYTRLKYFMAAWISILSKLNIGYDIGN